MKSLSTYLRLTITLVLLLTLSTCKKDREEECLSCGYEQGFEMVKDWMYFKTGSYWIYEEETSGAIDTITVWEHDEGLTSGGFDSFLTYTVSSYDGYFYRYIYTKSFTIHCLTTPVCDCEKVERSKSRPGDFVGSDKMFFFPPIVSNYSFLSAQVQPLVGGTSTVDDILENYSGYSSPTAVFHINADYTEELQAVSYYITKNIGIVRKELHLDNEIWNLIEYEVEQ